MKKWLIGITLLTQISAVCAEQLNLELPDSVTAPTPVVTIQEEPRNESLERSMRITRIALGTLAGTFLGLGYYFNHESNLRYNDYLAQPEGESRDQAWEDVRSAEKARNVFYSVAGGCVVGFGVTFAF